MFIAVQVKCYLLRYVAESHNAALKLVWKMALMSIYCGHQSYFFTRKNNWLRNDCIQLTRQQLDIYNGIKVLFWGGVE